MKRYSQRNIKMEKLYQQGRKDRQNGKPCSSANGAYLNGWYSDNDKPHYYLTDAEAREEILDD